MTPFSNPASIASQILAEIKASSWEVPFVRAIDELTSAIGSHPGTKRQRNEDRVAFVKVDAASGETYSAAIVCDGVGGSEMGDQAASIAVATFVDQLSKIAVRGPLSDLVPQLVRRMDDAIRDHLGGKGTTTASLVVASASGDLAAANIGDSRIFRWRSGKELRQISVDDTFENELKDLQLKDASVLDAHGLRGSLTQALGQGGRSSPELRVVVLEKEAFSDCGVILASDGIWKGSEEAFHVMAVQAVSPSELIRRSLMFATWSGGVDNASIAVIADPAAMVGQASEGRVGEARVCAWIHDAKVVLRASRSLEIKRAEVAADLGTESGARGRKQKARRKTADKVSDDGRQLSLTGDEPVAAKKGVVKPKVVISTDDDNHSSEE